MKLPLFLTPFVLLVSAAIAADDVPKHRLLSGVPFTDVKLEDEFWKPRIETNRTASLPHNIEWCKKTGRIDNFAKSGKLMEGKFQGLVFNDSDVYKVLEAASYSLAAHPDPALEKTVDEIIAKIAAAQQPDGYLNTYFTLAEPGKRLTNLRDMHELYCCGHLIEAAVAHFRATGKRTLLDVAVKYADFIDGVFGPTKRQGVPGHEEIELALVKLSQATGQEKYAALPSISSTPAAISRNGRLGASTIRTISRCGSRAKSSATRFGRCISIRARPTWRPSRATSS